MQIYTVETRTMLTETKLLCCCTLAFLIIRASAVVLSPFEEVVDVNEKTTNSSTSSEPAADVGQETVTGQDVIQFLESVKQFRSQSSSNHLSQSSTDSAVPRGTSQISDMSEEAVETKFDVAILLAFGITSAVLLIVLAATVVAIFVCCKRGKSSKKNLSLNSDLNRWDPQLLRPTKANIDAFIFGSPIPSFSEMIKQ